MLFIPILGRELHRRGEDTLYQFWLLLERNGTYGMSVESLEEAREFAEANGLEYERLEIQDGIVFLQVKQTPSLADFYTWQEVAPNEQPMREVWRPFLWSGGNTFGFQKDLGEILLSEKKCVRDVLQAFEASKALCI